MTDPTSLPNFPPPADEHPLRGRVLDVIQDLGVSPVIDEDGDVAFVAGEPPQQLFVRCMDGDFPVMRVFGQWQIGDPAPEDLMSRLERCNDFNLQLNIVKCGIANGNLVVTCDLVIRPETDLAGLFPVTVDLLMQVVGAWFGSFSKGRHEGPVDGTEA
ncbi:MAG TPA: YbjN domain-containing protein [Dermatophilaceae bacterium]|nr:YbjN domain-containing protein [Dermatophilaceae bacterium]